MENNTSLAYSLVRNIPKLRKAAYKVLPIPLFETFQSSVKQLAECRQLLGMETEQNGKEVGFGKDCRRRIGVMNLS